MAWLLFFDRYDFITQYKTVKELKKLEEEKQYYVDEIAKNERNLKLLKEDSVYLERFAREKYLMKQTGGYYKKYIKYKMKYMKLKNMN
jgi:cell division protein FtsB